MVMGTRNAPTFPHDVQKQLWDIRRESTMLSGFKFKEELEERLIQGLSVEEATAAVAEAEADLEAWKKASQRKKKGKTPEKPSSDEPVDGGEGTSGGGGDKDQTEDPELESEPEGEGKDKESSDKPSGVEPVAADPSDPDDSDDSDDGDERRRTSRGDGERVRGRTPRVETVGQSKKKLFKMTPPTKYSGDKDKERTYEAVQLFLSQVSRYLRLSTDVDMEDDIAEYATAFLDGFAYTWFDNLDKGNTPYLWKNFEAAMRKKFIPFSHIQKAITKYMAIKQTNGKSVAEYIVEREAMESMLGDELSAATIAGSFRENLNKWIRDRLISFADLPYDQYKHKAEVTDQEAQDQRVGPYASTREQTSRSFGKKGGSQAAGGSGSSGGNSNAGNTSKSGGKGGKKPQMSKKEMREKGVCFNCYGQGHLARDCPHPRRDGQQKKTDSKPESNSIRIQAPDGKTKRNLYHQKRDSRSYSNVVSGQSPPPSPNIPAIGLKETSSTSESSANPKPKPMFAKLPINGVESKSLIDTGSSDDFIGTHFATVNRLSVRNRETPVAIQQAIKGSKPKTNATTKVGIQFGEWTKNLEAHVAGLAGYDAIIGVPTLTDGDAVIDVAARTVYFRAWDFTVHCEIPEVPPKRPKKGGRWMGGKRAVNSLSKSQSSSSGKELKSGKKPEKPVVATATASITTTSPIPPPPSIPLAPRDIDKDGTPTYYRELLHKEFDDVLVDELPNELPPLREINHRIPYKPTKPWIAHKYRLPEAHKQALEEIVKPKLKSGILRFTSDVPLAPSHIVPKSEAGKFREVQDLRKRNEDTESMSWPMPDQEELVHRVAQSSNVSVGDMISAFDQTRIDPQDEKYATIINHMGIMQQRTIQQGDKNSVATQQRTMQHHLREDWGKNVTVYVDDMPIYDQKPDMSPYSHYQAVRRILLTLRKYKFYLNRKKTKFFVDMENEGVDILGRHIQNGEISIAKPKVDAFLALGSPTSAQELGKDLGTYNWLTDHLPWAATIAAPLQELYHSNSANWEWREVHEVAFKRMKELIAGAEVLVPLDLRTEAIGNSEKRIFVVSDSSLSGGGGYICQGKTLETARPAVYHSRVFTPAQTNYPVHEQELLALVDLVKSYEHWLLGRPFTAVTDSQAMLSLMKQKHLSPRQWRAMTYLSKFDMHFEFLPGKKNIIADLLSRIAERSTFQHNLPYLEESDELTDSMLGAIQLRRGKVLLEKPLIKKKSKRQAVVTPPPVSVAPPPASVTPPQDGFTVVAFDLSTFRQPIIDGYKEDTQFKKALKEGVESGVYVERDGLLYTGPGRNELCIPDVRVNGGRDGGKKNLRELLIAHCHEGTMGHFGTFKTAERLHEDYYWKSSTADVRKFVDSCHLCQTKKTSPSKQFGKNHPLPVPTKPWEWVSMDFLINLPSSMYNDQKYNNLFIVVCMLSKQAHLIPTTTTVKAEGVAKLYFDQIYRLHGLPKFIVSDRDTKFTGAFWRTLQRMVGTDLMMSTTDHPQTDGQTERTNRTVLQILRMYVNQAGSDWAQHLAAAEFAINSAVSRSTGKAPFEVVYGYLPRSFPPIVFDENNPASMDFLENRMLAQLSAQDSIIAAKTEQSYHVNKHRKVDPNFNVGDLVAISNESQLQHLPKGRQKLATKWVGPYKVLKVDKDSSNYKIEIPGSKRHPTFHVSYVKSYTDPHLDLFPNRQRRRPRIVNSEVDLNIEVQRIIGHQRRRDGTIHFLSLWEGYPAEDATYRHSELYKTSDYGVRLVEEYLRTFGELPDELAAWLRLNEWVNLRRNADVVETETAEAETAVGTDVVETETAVAETVAAEDSEEDLYGDSELVPGAPMDEGDSGVEVSGASSDKEDSGEEEVSSLWVTVELGDVLEDIDADAWSEVGRM